MRRILFCTIPEKGHLNPCIGPAQSLRQAGHAVAFYAPADITAQLDAAGGFRFLGSNTPPPRHDVSRGAAFAERIEDAAWLRDWIRTLLIDEAPAQVVGLRDVMRQWRPDVVVIDPLLYAAAIAACLEGLPWVALSNSLNPVLPDDLDSELLRTVRALSPARDALFARYGLTARFRGCDVLSPDLTIAFATEALVGAAPPGVHLVGPALPHQARGDEPTFPWQWLDGRRRLVYLSLGSQLYHYPEVFRRVALATQDLGVQLVISAGELAEAGRLTALGEHVLAVRYAPQLALLSRAHALVTHGGANSVMEALAAGVPMLMSPLCNDQFHCAHFVVRAGAGLTLDLRTATVDAIRTHVSTVLDDASLRVHSDQLAQSYRRDGSAEAARLIAGLALHGRPDHE